MKTFEDLKFNTVEPMGSIYNEGKIQATMEFDNGHMISVIGGKYCYGNGIDTFEIWRSIDSDIVGYLTKEEVTEHMIELQNVPRGTPINQFGYGGAGYE